jgi:hypothetical protein
LYRPAAEAGRYAALAARYDRLAALSLAEQRAAA